MPNLELFALCGIVLMSHRWLDSVGWDHTTGRLQIYDGETHEWHDYEPYVDSEDVESVRASESDGESDSLAGNSIATRSSDDEIELEEATLAIDDERHPLSGNDGIWRNEMRSRRGAS